MRHTGSSPLKVFRFEAQHQRHIEGSKWEDPVSSITSGPCTSKDGPNNGWANPLARTCHLCSDFLARIRALDGKGNRQARYFALVAHEWGHTCERGHKTLEIIDNEAFKFCTRTFVTSGSKKHWWNSLGQNRRR